MNKVTLIGRMTKDPELKYTPGKGTAVTTLTLAIDNGYGENKKTDFINIVVWGKSAESVANYTHKGSKIAVDGRIQTRSYDAKDGSKRYVTEVVANMYGGVEFLDSKGSNIDNIQQQYENIGMQEIQDDGDIPF